MQDNQESGHFSQEELDAIVSGGVTPKLPTDFGTPPQEEPEQPIWDTADAVMAVPRGVVGFGKSVWNLADWASFDLLPDWHTNPLGTSKSTVGGFVEGISQIAAGFGAGGLALKAATKIPGAVGAASAWLSGAGGGAAGVVRGGLTKGAIADFISFEGNAGRLSDLLVETDNPALNNAVTQYLATDMEDGELEGRLKNALEGAVLGVALEGVIAGIKGSAKAVKTYRAAKAAGASEEAAVKQALDVSGDDLRSGQELLEKAEFEDVSPTRPDQAVDAGTEMESAFKVEEPPVRTFEKSDYEINRGSGAIIDRINREASQGRLDRADANFMVGLVGRLGDDVFSKFGVRFRNLGDTTQGTFNFLTDIITVSTQATDKTRTFVHEVWHSMTGRLDEKMLVAVNKDFQKALRKFEVDHGLKKGSLKDGLDSAARKVIKEKNLEKSEWYRLTDLDEWVAENMTDATFARLDLEEDTKSVFGFLRYFVSNFLTEFKAKFGGDKYNKLAKDWLDKRYAKAPEVAQGLDRSFDRRLGYMRDAEARDVGGPNFGLDDARGLSAPAASSAAVRQLEDLINTGAGVDAVAAKIEELREAGVINLRPVTKDGSPGSYAEALIAINQAEGNLDSFGPASPKGSNKLAQQQAAANVNAAIESGGLNAAEVNKVMADGVASAAELNRRLPFLLGLESAMRYQALQALRSGRADTDQVMQAFTLVAGASRTVKSYLGKNLQMIQAFGNWEGIMRSYNELNPSQQAALQERFADVLQLLVLDPKTGRDAARVLTEKVVSKSFRIGAEAFRNSILSGAKTIFVNMWSAAEALMLPLERSTGRLLAGQGTQAAKELSTITRYWAESGDALTALWLSVKEEGDSITLGRGNTQFGEFQPQRAISSKNFARLNAFDPATGGSARTIAGLAVDFVGQVVGLPMRFMGSSDEFFTTLMARAEADVVLRRIVAQDRKLPMTSVQVSTEVERLKKLLFVDGQLYTRRTTLERGMRLARDKYLPAAFRETLEESVAAAKGLDAKDPAVQAEVSRLYSQAVEGGKVKAVGDLRKSKDSDVLLKSLDTAGRKSRANPMFIPEVQRFVDQNWDAYVDEDFMGAGLGANLQGQTGQDYKILQKASSEIERRVREATWKREYDDMAESSVYGTRLVGNIGKATASAVSHVPALQLVVPFIRTPTNLLAFVTDRNPVGRMYDWVQAARAGDKEAVAEATGRLATGTLLYTTGIALAANGMVTGRGPKDPELRKQLLASGWMPYSFRFGDTYVSYGRNDPIATFLGLVADTFEIASNTYDPSPEDQDAVMQIATAVIGSVANNVTNKSYLRGIVTTLGALTGDENDFKRLQRQYAGALVPNVLAQAETYGMDPDVREVRSMMDAIRARLPGYGDSVDKVRNALGEPLKGNEGWGSMFLPGTASSRTKDPVKRELADSLISVGAPRSTLPGGIDLRAIKLKNGQSAYDRLQELTGQMRINGKSVKDQLSSLIQSPFYRQLPQMGQDNLDSPRVSLVRGYVSNYRRAAMQQLMQESPELARAVAHSREVKASMLR
jgi:hypothetical protein